MPPLPLRRKLLYAAIASLGVTLLTLLAAEGALRLAGFGHSPRFAVRARTAAGEPVWRENRWCTAPFFTPERVRRPQPFRLPVAKQAREYRVFVLGSSAAMGDPEASFSFARILEAMLRAAYPDIHVTVVNAAVTAVNSHVVRGIAADCAKLQPDLFIVYEGHNEVIGPYGPAAVFAPFLRSETAVRLAAATRGTRTAQFLHRAVRRQPPGVGRDDWQGMRMFLEHEIDASDPKLEIVRRLFRANLEAIAASTRRAGAPLLLCTVLTNQRDFAPFRSRHRPNLAGDQLEQWETHQAAGQAAEARNDLAAAEREYHAALAIDDGHAGLVFRAGRVALLRGDAAGAQRLLARATDLDTLRFRTDSALNEAIRAAAAASPGATLVDLAHEVGASARDGIPGDDLLYEHVHLTFRGAYEVASRLLPHVVADLKRRGLATGNARESLSLEAARQRLAFTTYEQAMIGLELLRRFRAPPFAEQPGNEARIAAWEYRVATARTLLTRGDAGAALTSIYEQALAAAPDDWVIARNAGAMLVARGEPAKALPLLERARASIPDDPDTLIALGFAHRGLGQTDEAEKVFDEARALEPRHPLLPK